MTPKTPLDIDPENIVDQLYDIAIDPNSLDPFVDAWNAAGLDASATRKTIETIDNFDAAYLAHLKRAGTFLARGDDTDAGPDLAAILTPFRDLAAFIVDRKLSVVASNAGAQQAFEMLDDTSLGDMRLAPDTIQALNEALTSLFNDAERPDRLLRLYDSGERGTALFNCAPYHKQPCRIRSTPSSSQRATIGKQHLARHWKTYSSLQLPNKVWSKRLSKVWTPRRYQSSAAQAKVPCGGKSNPSCRR